MAVIVAEVGQNFVGDISLAQALIVEARKNGADLVKFQLYDHDKLYSNHPEIPNSSLTFKQAQFLYRFGEDQGIEVFFSVFDVERVNWCEEIGVQRYKIARSMRDADVLGAVLATGKPVIISIKLDEHWQLGMTNLYCPDGYPAEPYQMPEFCEAYGFGLSDHSIGIDIPKIALARGAQVIEKHFAINHTKGVDAPWSMVPSQLRELKRFEQVVQGCL